MFKFSLCRYTLHGQHGIRLFGPNIPSVIIQFARGYNRKQHLVRESAPGEMKRSGLASNGRGFRARVSLVATSG